jgi:DNA-binding Xre family transcriptional regulator
MGIRWNLRRLMAERDLYQTSDLVPLLAERGINLSREQVYRLVTQIPQRLSTDTLAALCDILGCTPNDLIEVQVVNEQIRKTAGDERSSVPIPVTRVEDTAPGGAVTARDTWRAVKFEVVRECLCRVVPQLDEIQVAEILKTAQAANGRALRELALHLTDQPDALTSGNSNCPPSMVRLAHALHSVGHTQIARPSCSECGRMVIKLPARGSKGRMCSNCAQLTSRDDCARCERVNVRIAARRAEGLICQRCYSVDPDVVEPCAGCGRVRQAATRGKDGRPLCQGCWEPPSHRCALCGTDGPAVVIDDDGPVCRSCYERVRRPRRECSRCGKVGRISISPADGGGEICANCNRGPIKQCAECDKTRPCRQFGPNRLWTCGICRRAADFCARCHRFRPVQARWPLGPVCNTCYAVVLDTPGPCSLCQSTAPLVGRDEHGLPLCGPCCGLPAHACRRCGQAGRRYADQVCARCVLEDRLAELLDPAQVVAEQLRPVYDAFLADANPRSLIRWLSRSPNARLLKDLATSGEQVSHESLDALIPSRYEAYVRQMLVHTKVLPERDEDVERVPAWLEQRLIDRPAEHASLLRPFVHWHLLRRARRRGLERRYPASAKSCCAAEPPWRWTSCAGWTSSTRPSGISHSNNWTNGSSAVRIATTSVPSSHGCKAADSQPAWSWHRELPPSRCTS